MTFVDICRRHINLFLFALITRKRGQTFVSPIEFFEQLVLVTMRIDVYFLRRKIGIVLPSLDFDIPSDIEDTLQRVFLTTFLLL